MSSTLYSLKNNLNEYAEIISEAINVDVEIVDKDLIRIAGTGSKKNLTDIYMEEEGHICKQVIKSKSKIVVERPGLHRICLEKCMSKKNCDMTFVISNPIIYDNQAIGAINLVCFTKEQKISAKNNIDMLSKFFNSISQLIAAEAGMLKLIKEKEFLINEFGFIVDMVEEGVIVLNEDLKIRYVNKKSEEMLGYSDEEIKGEFFNDLFYFQNGPIEEISLDSLECEYYFDKNKKRKVFTGRVSPIYDESKIKRYLFHFREKEKRTKVIKDIEIEKEYTYIERFIGENASILKLKRRIKKYSKSDSVVLIQGETGTGKEIVAKTLHYEGNRKDNPFVVVNCGAIPENLLESELFGYTKGSFTGADRNGKVGKFEIANNGTIFLDEIGDMPMQLQVKLLRVLQENKIQRIGSNEDIPLDIRVISATNKDLKELIRDGTFREDLYYRLCVIPIKIPPLRNRIDDLDLLISYFIKKKCEKLRTSYFKFDEETVKYLKNYNWPGNVRELENFIEYVANTIEDKETIVKSNILPEKILAIKNITSKNQPYESNGKYINLEEENQEKMKIINLLEFYGDNTEGKKRVAEELGISLSTLYRKINRNKIKRQYM